MVALQNIGVSNLLFEVEPTKMFYSVGAFKYVAVVIFSVSHLNGLFSKCLAL